MSSVFETLNALNINEHTEMKKSGNTELTYLSWPWAWAEVKKRYPSAHYTIWKQPNGVPYSYDPATGYMVYTSVTIDGVTHEMWLPCMDGANKAMKSEEYTYTVKNPMFKYARLDPSTGKYLDKFGKEQPEYFVKKVAPATMFDINKTIMRCLVKNLAMFGLGLYIYAGEDLPEGEQPEPEKPILCECCGAPILATQKYSVNDLLQIGKKQFSMKYCYSCLKKKGETAKKKADAMTALENYGD